VDVYENHIKLIIYEMGFFFPLGEWIYASVHTVNVFMCCCNQKYVLKLIELTARFVCIEFSWKYHWKDHSIYSPVSREFCHL